jgi:hypothetical protein
MQARARDVTCGAARKAKSPPGLRRAANAIPYGTEFSTAQDSRQAFFPLARFYSPRQTQRKLRDVQKVALECVRVA